MYMKKGSGGSFWIKRVKDKRKAMEKQEKRNFNGKKYRGKQTDSNKGKKSGEMKKPVQKQKSVCPVFEKCGGCQLLDVPP